MWDLFYTIAEELRRLCQTSGQPRINWGRTEVQTQECFSMLLEHNWYNNCLWAKRSGDRTKSLRQEEKQFRQNPWAFAKKVCNDVKNFDPSFDKTAALSHFANTASRDHSAYSSMPAWIHEVMPAPTEPALIPFDLSPITPSLVKRTLYSRSSNSSPGYEGISYHHLKKMSSTHHYLATLFSKMLLENQEAPHPWSGARIKLIHKGGDTNIPSNFWPIALSSVVGKLNYPLNSSTTSQVSTPSCLLTLRLNTGQLHLSKWKEESFKVILCHL